MSEEEKDKSLASAKVVVKEAGFLIFQLILSKNRMKFLLPLTMLLRNLV